MSTTTVPPTIITIRSEACAVPPTIITIRSEACAVPMYVRHIMSPLTTVMGVTGAMAIPEPVIVSTLSKELQKLFEIV